jgi:hypothetical protein
MHVCLQLILELLQLLLEHSGVLHTRLHLLRQRFLLQPHRMELVQRCLQLTLHAG